MMNLVSVKNYSTSSLPSNSNTAKLDPILFEKWTKEEVCSLLCSAGGAGLTVEEVAPLHDAGFDGYSLANIVTFIQKRDEFFAIEQLKATFKEAGIPLTVELRTTLQTVVFWVDKLLKTRLCHLWNEENICKPMVDGGLGLTSEQAKALKTQSKVPDSISQLMQIQLVLKDFSPTIATASDRDIKTDLQFNAKNPFVDRHYELLQILNHAFKRVALEKPVLVYTISAPGMGKSALLAEWMNQLTNHQKKVVVYRFLNGVRNNDEELCFVWYEKLMGGALSLNQIEMEKIRFLNSVYICNKVGDYIGVNLTTDLKQLISQLEKEGISQDSPQFGISALTTILKVGIARKYQGETIIYGDERFNINTERTGCDLATIKQLPEFITKTEDPLLLLKLWKDFSNQNSKGNDLLFKYYRSTTKPFLYIAIDEIQELSTSVSKKNGAYHLLSAILSIRDNPYYNVFVLSAGISMNHSFHFHTTTEFNYPPSPIVETRYLNDILMDKYGKQLYKKIGNFDNLLCPQLSDALIIEFYKCGGIARYISELLATFEPLIKDNIESMDSISEAVKKSEQNIRMYLRQRGDYFSSISVVQKALLIWFCVIPLSLSNKTRLTVPGRDEISKFNPTLKDLQQMGIIVPFTSSQDFSYYYIPYFMRVHIRDELVKNTFKQMLANKDGAQICDMQYLFVDPHVASKTISSNDLGKLFEMTSINSIWCMYKYFKQISNTVTVKSLFPEISYLGGYRTEYLFVEWDGMILLNNQFDYTNESTCIEPNYLYKNGDNAQHGDILFIAKTFDGTQMKVAIECRNLRNQVSLTDIINRGIHILFGRSHLDLKQELTTHKKKKQKQEAVKQWIEAVLGEQFYMDFENSLQDGIVLCNLINKIKPNSISKIHQSEEQQQENVHQFLKAALSLGLPQSHTFEPQDLKNKFHRVVDCLISLENILRQSYTFTPLTLDSNYIFTCKDIVKKQEHVQKWKTKSSFDVFILLAPNQAPEPTDEPKGVVQKKYDSVRQLWKEKNQLIIFNGHNTIHDHTLKYLKECIPQVDNN